MERERTDTRHVTSYTRKTPLRALAGGLLAGILFAACSGDNLFVDFTPGQAESGDVPTVTIDVPSSVSIAAIPLGDSVLVTATISDDAGVTSVVFEGLALRGDASLGTATVVTRFVSKTVNFLPEVADTTISRYLLATPDTILETSLIIVTAFDVLGNSAADTVSLILGGPHVEFQNLVGGELIQSGLTLGLRVLARDGAGVREVEITITGVVTETILVPVSPVLDSLVVDTLVVIPSGVSGTMTITARATNTLGVVGQAGPFTVTVTTTSTGDAVPPGVQVTATSNDRLEFQDLINVVVTSADDNQGSGVARTGYTVLGISARRGDTVAISNEVVFASPRTGTVIQSFDFTVFNFDPLQLPDTMVYEVFGYSVDAAGNCAASVGEPALVSYICGSLGGNTVAENRTGSRLTRVIVAGRTILLPTGGGIADAVMDTIRKKLYLTNIENGRVEVFRLLDETFEQAVLVGSEPWGLTMNRGEDTLLVANSGGANIDMIYLGATDGSEVPVQDVGRRLFTPDVVLFDVEETLDDQSQVAYKVTFLPDATPPGFSDLPQFVAVDFTGRVLYSTKTSLLGDFGTIRKAEVFPGRPDTEVTLFVQHAAMIESDAFTGVAHANIVGAVPTGMGDDIFIGDHTPGDRLDVLGFTDVSPATAGAGIQALGSDVVIRSGQWSVENIGFADTTFVTASGNGRWVVFGEGAVQPVGRVIMYNATTDVISGAIQVADLMINRSETVRGIGLNYDGTLGVALGSAVATFFSNDLQVQGSTPITPGGSGAVLHPLHANVQSVDNPTGFYQPDTHMAFVGSGDGAIEILDTFNPTFPTGRIFIRDIPSGPLKAVLPFPGDNAGLTCATKVVLDEFLNDIGSAVEIFAGGNFAAPHPAIGPPTEDACIVAKLIVITDVGGVVVIDVRKSDVLSLHPTRN